MENTEHRNVPTLGLRALNLDFSFFFFRRPVDTEEEGVWVLQLFVFFSTASRRLALPRSLKLVILAFDR